jgi:hypothetical protein
VLAHQRRKARHEPPENPVSRKIDSGRKDTRPNFATANAIAMETSPAGNRTNNVVATQFTRQGCIKVHDFLVNLCIRTSEYQSRFVSKIKVNYEL